uniref:Beta-defensin-like domain-containing protein n=1 Tax=Malurus cyaneus samueli TaxID=2593467 RepID=A0A8C5TED7_9PASS
MRILHVLLAVLFLLLQGAAGQHGFPRPFDSCMAQNGRCFPGICRYPFFWIGTCSNGYSCCRKWVA